MKAQAANRRPVAVQRVWKSLLAIVVSGSLSACAGLGSQNEIMSKDLLEIKTLSQGIKSAQESNGRRVDYRLGALEDKIQTRNDQLRESLTDIEKRLREEREEVLDLRKLVSDLSFQIGTLTTKLDMQGTETARGATGTVAQEPKQGADEMFRDALRQYNLGRYDLAREGFEKALEQNPTGELGIKTLYWLAETCFRQPDLEPAGEFYTQLIQSNPSHHLAWKSLERLADINHKQGRTSDALSMYESIATGHPGYEGIERVKEQIRILREAQSGGGDASPANS